MTIVKTSRVVTIMLAVSFAMAAAMAYLQISAFFLSTFLVPALIAAYYQRQHGVHLDKPQRKRISLWYIGISSTIGIIGLAILVNETKDQLNEPLIPVAIALAFGVVALTTLAYFVVYWILGMSYVQKNTNP